MAELWRLAMAGEFTEAFNAIVIPVLLERLLPAIAIFVIGRIAARVLTSAARRIMTKAGLDETLAKFLGNIISSLLTVVVVLAALQSLGVETTSFAAILAAAGFAIGMALQGSLGNFASGVMLILFKPFKVGDFISAGGTVGTVEEIQLFSTIMETGDNVRIIVPNGQITSAVISNFSANDTRRIDLVIGCGYSDDLQAVKQFFIDTVAADDRVLAEPEAVVAVDELGESSVNFVVRPWVNASDYWDVKRDLVEAIKAGFDARGFSFPYPSSDVYMHQSS
jgi:small conductance mechanosensitive channel